MIESNVFDYSLENTFLRNYFYLSETENYAVFPNFKYHCPYLMSSLCYFVCLLKTCRVLGCLSVCGEAASDRP